MARSTKYNKQGAIIMGAAAYHARIFTTREMAEHTGIPYRTVEKRLLASGDFDGAHHGEIKRFIRAAGMTPEEIGRLYEVK